MASRIRTIISRLFGSYSVTGSIQQSFRFALKLGQNKKSAIRISNGQRVFLRKNETDQEVFISTFLKKYHSSPINLGASPVIVDLGSNIGLTIVDFKKDYPSATTIGVELDKENYELCKINTQGLQNCILIHAAIWKENGYINYKGTDEQSYIVERDSLAESGMVRCLTMDSLFKEQNLVNVDYIKIDIEGAEKAILLESKKKTWLQHVKYISIEVHDWIDTENTFLFQELAVELEANQFIVYRSASHISSLFAINKLFIAT